MNRLEFTNLKHSLSNYGFSSMNYCEYDDVATLKRFYQSNITVIYLGRNEKAAIKEIHWRQVMSMNY